MTTEREALDPIFVITADGDVDLYRSVAHAEGGIEGYDVADGEYGGDLGGLFSIDGEILILVPGEGEVWAPVRIERSGRYELDVLSKRLTELAARNAYAADPDPRVVANRIFAAQWSLRLIRWPKWLDVRLNGEGPPRVS